MSNSNLSKSSNITSTIITGSNNYYNLNYNFSAQFSFYDVLGEKVRIDSPKDQFLAQNISLINVLGKPFYDELIKNGFIFMEEIESVLQKKFKILERDKKINSVLDNRKDDNR